MDLLVKENEALVLPKLISFDTETTGLMPYHGDKIFAISVSDGLNNYYIKIKDKLPQWLKDFLDEPTNCIVGHNIKFDLHFLGEQFGIFPKCQVIDTMVLARLEFNDHLSYGLADCAARIGLEKDDAVEKYISEHKLWEWETIPGKKVRKKNKFYDKVPFDIMFKYACRDAEITYKLYQHLVKRLSEIDALMPDAPSIVKLAEQESALLKVVQLMEFRGVDVDLEYSKMAFDFYQGEAKFAEEEFKKLTGQPYKSSPKMFAEIFSGEKDKWAYTEKGNPSFDSDVIGRFDNPAAKQILVLRDAKSRSDFFASFEHFADNADRIHPNFNQAGTATGRFSSSDPNFQNQTNDEEAAEGTLGVRSAIIPPGDHYCIVSFDYDQQEYKMMLDYAGEMELIEQVKNGTDVHQATADMMGTNRKFAKCIAKGSLILTNVGLVPIENVTCSMLVWDGREWVTHSGVISKGEQELIEYDGLRATKDHKVYTECGRFITLSEAKKRKLSLIKTEIGGAAYRVPSDTEKLFQNAKRRALLLRPLQYLFESAYPQASFGGSILERNSEEKAQRPIYEEVFDLVNAGPRNRFTCSGALVSNCLNFMLLYGGGVGKLAEALKLPEWEARSLRDLYFSKLPKVQKFISTVISTAKQRGYVYNWAGRRYFCQPEFAYKMPNRIIQGGGADVIKRAMVEIDKLLVGKQSYPFMTVHDELDFYIHKDELDLIPKIKSIMENAYPHRNLPLTVSVSHSWEDLGSLKDGAPTPKEGLRPPALRTDKRQPTETELLCKCFGVDIAEVRKVFGEFAEYRVVGSTLFVNENRVALVEYDYLTYNAKQFGVNLDMYR